MKAHCASDSIEASSITLPEREVSKACGFKGLLSTHLRKRLKPFQGWEISIPSSYIKAQAENETRQFRILTLTSAPYSHEAPSEEPHKK